MASRLLAVCAVVILSAVTPRLTGAEPVVVIAEGATWAFFRGTEAPPEDWNQPSFDDSGWEHGPTGIGYGDEDDNTVLDDMRCTRLEGAGEEAPCAGGGYLVFFARTSFELPAIPDGERLFLRLSYDDGAVIYVNSIEIARINMPDGPITHESPATDVVGDAPEEPDAVVIVPADVLLDGTNVIAASVHNRALTSSDASFIPRLLTGSPEEPPGELTCEERCERSANERFAGCIAELGNEEECAARRRAFLEDCIGGECDGEEPPGELTCEERCERSANERFAGCIAELGNEEECAARRRAFLEDCIGGECDGEEPPGELTCEERCERSANERFAGCIAELGNEEECAARRRAFLEDCIGGECDGEEPPGELPCEDRCERSAAEVFHACREDGGGEDECGGRASDAFRECLGGCGEEPSEPRCDEECDASGDALLLACLEAGGDEEECHQRADAIVHLCLERCGVGTPCEDRCAVAAQIVLAGCLFAELPEMECRSLANDVLERCGGNCEPAESCASRCETSRARAVSACRERGGGEDDCFVQGNAVLEDCLAHCDGEPMPPCDVQCEEMSTEVFGACREDGGEVGECEEAQARFFAECAREIGTMCETEEAALLSDFQLFLRGDVNRDDFVDISDPLTILDHLFLGGTPLTCEDAADANDDGQLNISDPMSILNVLFLGASPMPGPLGQPGHDPTSDALLCVY